MLPAERPVRTDTVEKLYRWRSIWYDLKMPMPVGYYEPPNRNFNRLQIESVWTYVALENGQHRVLPDGRCDIILRLARSNNQSIYETEVIVTGPSTQFHMVPLAKGMVFIGARLRPGFAEKILGINPATIVNQVLAGEELFVQHFVFSKLCKPVATIDGAVDRLDKFISGRVNTKMDFPGTARSFGLIDALHVGGGRLSETDLAKMFEIDARTVRRNVQASTGLTPKAFSMIIQFHRAVRLIRDFKINPISAALEAGYADQAHMTRMFKRLGGFTPARLPDLTLVSLPI